MPKGLNLHSNCHQNCGQYVLEGTCLATDTRKSQYPEQNLRVSAPQSKTGIAS